MKKLLIASVAAATFALIPSMHLAAAEPEGVAPVNDDCANALPIDFGTFTGSTVGATNDGAATCGNSAAAPDVWFKITAPFNHFLVANTFGSSYDTVLSVHTGCPGSGGQISCNDNYLGVESGVSHFVLTGEEVYLRVSGNANANGPFTLSVGQAGTIQGEVTEAASGLPVPDVLVAVFNAEGRFLSSERTTGRYSLSGLQPGEFFVSALAADGLVGELYDDIPCPRGGCDPTTGTSITVPFNTVRFGVDFALDFSATISGTVRSATGEPLFAFVRAWSSDRELVRSQVTDPSGNYSLPGLSAGQYFVTAGQADHRDEVFDNIPCPRASCDPTSGIPIAVDAGSSALGVDFELDPLGTLEGRVTDAVTGEPIPFYEIQAVTEAGFFNRQRQADSEGFYSIPIDSGTHFVRAPRLFGYRSELFDDVPCGNGSCGTSGATGVIVNLGEPSLGIDFALDRGGVISGTVSDSSDGGSSGGGSSGSGSSGSGSSGSGSSGSGSISSGLADVGIILRDAENTVVEETSTDATGHYTLDGLVSGTYFLGTTNASPYVNERYDDLPCLPTSCELTAGTPIAVTVGETTVVDLSLDLGGSITGMVTDEAGDRLDNVPLSLHDTNGAFVDVVLTNGEGEYALLGLAAGNYFLRTGSGTHLNEIWDDVPCPPVDCDPLSGSPIAVALGAATPQIDFALTAIVAPTCVPSPTALCLNDDRFRVEVEWRDFVGQEGSGQGVELTDDTGTFWFFSPENVELVVKVLDACFDPFDRFWVFAGGLTDVATELTVTDTVSGEVKRYSHLLGTDFAPVQDFDAFATCPARPSGGRLEASDDKLSGKSVFPGTEASWGRAESNPVVSGPVVSDPVVSGPVLSRPSVSNPVASEVGGVIPCVPLCFHDGRFTVTAEWETGDQSGVAQAVPLTDDTGTFWFFSPDNIEVVVKVLDACGLDPFNNFWVFAAGLTDVRVTLRVTDTLTFETQEWVNPQGGAFQPIRETQSFRSCP